MSASYRIAALCLLSFAWTPRAEAPPRFDLAIVGGELVDGSGAPRRRADIGIRGGRIVEIGTIGKADAREAIDAAGLIVAPGFIDVHTHADDVAEHPDAANFVRMGVTSIVAGNCGGSALDIGAALARIRQVGTSINYATLIGHNTVRRAVMGPDNRPPTLPELDRMKSLVWRAMQDGAVGFSTGLEYVPGTYAGTPEITELARVSANAGGVYASHMRNEGSALEAAVLETIRVGEVTGSRVEISHLKVDSPNRWGASVTALAIIDDARKRGVDVEADLYAYTAASSNLGIRFPSWVLAGGQEKIAARLEDPSTWEKIKGEMRALLAQRGLADLSFGVVAAYRANPALNGLSMKQVAARLRGSESPDAQFEAAREMLLAGGASMVYHLMSDEDVDRIMRHPKVAIASDSDVLVDGEGVPHPRGYGNNARVLGEYVRRRHVITLEDAVRKMTSLPAEHFRFEGRGLIRKGYAADVVVFDAARVSDTATFEKPHAFPAGIPWVVVDGMVVVANGEQGAAKPGQILGSAGARGSAGAAVYRSSLTANQIATGASTSQVHSASRTTPLVASAATTDVTSEAAGIGTAPVAAAAHTRSFGRKATNAPPATAPKNTSASAYTAVSGRAAARSASSRARN